MDQKEQPNFTSDFIVAGLKLTERDLLRHKFAKPMAAPQGGGGLISSKDNLLADVLADPLLAEAFRPFFSSNPEPPDTAAWPELPRMLPWGYRLAQSFVSDPLAGVDTPGLEEVRDFTGRIAALMVGAAVSGVALLDDDYLYSHTLDGRPIIRTEANKFKVDKEAVSLPFRADRVLVLGFLRDPVIMGSHPVLRRIEPDNPWLDLSKQISATFTLTDFLGAMGYLALPSAGGLLLANHLGAQAGLGELGRQGLLISPEYGPNLRLMTIITDYPFVPDSPLGFGVTDYCDTCHRCINKCPVQAIATGYGDSGLYRWAVDRQACFSNWYEKKDPCRKCIEICPYTREPLVGSHRAVSGP